MSDPAMSPNTATAALRSAERRLIAGTTLRRRLGTARVRPNVRFSGGLRQCNTPAELPLRGVVVRLGRGAVSYKKSGRAYAPVLLRGCRGVGRCETRTPKGIWR